jgi:serine protease Do
MYKKYLLSTLIIAIALWTLPVMSTLCYGAVKMVPASFAELAKQAKPGVVNIQTEKIIQGGGRVFRHFFGSPFGVPDNHFEDFFAPFFDQHPKSRKENSLGSGFIVSKDGYIVTNNHVIQDADKIKVILHDNKEYDANIIGTDPMTDLALIKIDTKNLIPLKFGSSEKAEIGSWVVAIGNPFGLEQTVTAGIISAKGRTIGAGPYDDFIQTDASINPGNSGGPLLNLHGEVIGINTAIIKSGQGIGFAIPSDLATGIISQLTEQQTVSRGWMGVGIQEVTEQLAQYYGLKDVKGVYVTKVFDGEPAQKAGIQAGDVISHINNKAVNSQRELVMTIGGIAAGKTVDVTLVREGKKNTVKVQLGERPLGDHEAPAQKDEHDPFGFKFSPLTPDIIKRFRLPANLNGLMVTDIEQGSKADESGVRLGDILLEINRYKVENLHVYQKYLKRINKGEIVRLLFTRRGGQFFVIAVTKP